MDAFLKISQRAKDVIANWLGLISSLFLLILTLFALLEIIRRYIFGVVFEWGQDGIIVGMISAVALYLCVTQTRRSHLVMNAIILGVGFLHIHQFFLFSVLNFLLQVIFIISATIIFFTWIIFLIGLKNITIQ